MQEEAEDWTAAAVLLLDGCNRLARQEMSKVGAQCPRGNGYPLPIAMVCPCKMRQWQLEADLYVYCAACP